MVFARHQSRAHQSIVAIGEASSGFLPFVPTVFTAVINADPICGRHDYLVGVHLLGQHSRKWDEGSSPGELIHPGDLATIARITIREGTRGKLRHRLNPEYVAVQHHTIAQALRFGCRERQTSTGCAAFVIGECAGASDCLGAHRPTGHRCASPGAAP